MARRTSILTALALAPILLAIGPDALSLRDRGVAELENERPGDAETTFARLAKLTPEDPLAYANLAISTLRQQKSVQSLAAIDRALAIAPGRPDLLAIKGDVLQWSGRADLALESYRAAASAAPNDVEIQYALYRHATTLADGGREAADEALARLESLRPDNLVVMLQRGQRAIETGDRAAASGAFLRVRELVWQAPPIATKALDMLMEALEGEDVTQARIPALRLENVLKVTPMFQQGLRELATGIQGIPVLRFAAEPAPTAFGETLDVSWAAHRLSGDSTVAVAVEDFDADGVPDIAVAAAGRIGLRPGAKGWTAGWSAAATGADHLLAADLDNDGSWDLVATGRQLSAWRGEGGALTDATEGFGLAGTAAATSTVLDFDIEGDLDLVTGSKDGVDLLLNTLEGPLQSVGERVFRAPVPGPVNALAVADFDRDGDLDLVATGPEGTLRLDNLRQGEMVGVVEPDLAAVVGRDVATADLDGDARPDVIVATSAGISAWANQSDGLTSMPVPATGEATAVEVLDIDNDGRLDLAVAGPGGVTILHRRGDDLRAESTGMESPAHDLRASDLDGDGDLDLVVAAADGLHWLENEGGNENGWLSVELRGLTKGNSKNNVFGLGSSVEVLAGPARQFREAQSGRTHIGLGGLRDAALLRVVWTNGVPQNRLDVAGEQRVVEEQILKGSCPFLYTWDGEEVRFVSDLLWGAPIGLPVAAGIYAGADPSELVEVVGAQPRDGRYDLRITEELWEAAFFDSVRLWVVDHPTDVEVASNLRIVPGRSFPERVLGSRDVRPVAAAWDGRGDEVTGRVHHRDHVYADGFEPSAWQGLADRPWTFTVELGDTPNGPVRLLLDGWIFPADASLNLALAQRGAAPMPPRLEVETAEGWIPLLDEMGFPPGKTKTMVVDTPPLPEGAHRLRIVTSQWLSWDRIAWTLAPADDAPELVARLAPSRAELAFRGFSAPVRRAPNAPHEFDYARSTTESPWIPFPGRYTRYGDVRPLLGTVDDESVVLAAGDEMQLEFDAGDLPPVRPGWTRTVFLESHGWDKDADRNTGAAEQVEPLPFRAMTSYPYDDDEVVPDGFEVYQATWLTREIEGFDGPEE